MSRILELTYALVWGVPALVMILGVGLYLSIRTGFAQVRLFPAACREFACRLLPGKQKEKGVSSFQALCTALAATVGTGNLAGVAGAIAIGGPGAIFWMWICGILGMMTKLAEAVLCVRFRVKEDGEYHSGPMYMIVGGMKKRWHRLAGVYAFFGITASFGVGNATQVNAVITGIQECVQYFGGASSPGIHIWIGAAMAVGVWLLLSGGARRIAGVSGVLVPVAAVCYFLLGSAVLVLRADAILPAFASIVTGAFSPRAVTGGMLGSFLTTLRVGVSRGVFTNEAGMGTAGIAHGSASVDHPVQQGLMGIIEVFVDTIVICTMTALVILCSGVAIPYGTDVGVSLTMDSFAVVLGPWTRLWITGALCLFAFATILGWGLYGTECVRYLFGKSSHGLFVCAQTATVMLGAVLGSGTVWLLAEIVNGLMAIPNLIALTVLSGELCRLLKDYQRKSGKSAGGGTLCKFPLTQTAANRHLCGNSIPLRWLRRKRERKFIT